MLVGKCASGVSGTNAAGDLKELLIVKQMSLTLYALSPNIYRLDAAPFRFHLRVVDESASD